MARLVYLLSPAKTLDMSVSRLKECTDPRMLTEAHDLVRQLQRLSQAKLKSLLGVSDVIAKTNFDRYKSFDFGKVAAPNEQHKQCALAFNGPAYGGLSANDLKEDDLRYAQRHLRILCGLYGALRPLDLIQAYRLEMGSKFANSKGKDLYEYWGDKISQEINSAFNEMEQEGGDKVLVNVASQEYFKSIVHDALDDEIHVVECVFKDDGKVKSVYAKRARGLMCRYLIENRVDSVDAIKNFDLEGYKFADKDSTDSVLIFHRSAKDAKRALEKRKAGDASSGDKEEEQPKRQRRSKT